MSFDPDRVEAVSFDSYSTLLDVGSAREAVAEYTDDPDRVAALWRRRALQYSLVAPHIEGYDTYYQLHRDGLGYALEAHGIDVSPAEADEINAVYHDLEPFDDVREGMERLTEAGYRCYVLSNGDPAMLDSLVETTGIEGVLEDAISADEIEVFKPAPELYRHGAARMGTPIGRIAHVAAGWFDVMGAMGTGMQGVWLNREGKPWEPFDGDPDLEIETIHDLADRLGA